MKKIKTLKRIVLILFIITLLWFLADNVMIVLAILFEKNVLPLGHFGNENVPFLLKFLVMLKTLTLALFIYGSYFLIKILQLKNSVDFLNNNTSTLLNKAGKLIIISTAINFALSFSIFFIDLKYLIYFQSDSRSLSLLMLVFGLFLIIFGKVIETAKELKQENDLTI